MMNSILDNLLDESGLAAVLNLPLRLIRRWRTSGDGPAFLQFGDCVRYRPEDVLSWLKSRETPRQRESEVAHAR